MVTTKGQQGDDVKQILQLPDDSVSAGVDGSKEGQLEGLAPEKAFGFLDSNEDAYYEHLSKKIGRGQSLDDLTKVEVIKEPELQRTLRSSGNKKETGRGLSDFLKANKTGRVNPKRLLMEHIRQTEGLDGELLKDFELNYLPTKTRFRQRARMAKIRFEQRYKMLETDAQQKQFTLPTDDMESQRQAVNRQRLMQSLQGMLEH